MKHPLFACTHNAGRSQIAQAFFERHAPADMRAESAGQQPRREGVWLGQLAVEFAGLRSDAEIRLCADAVLGEFADTSVRSHVMTIAYRKTRDCLRAAHCDAISA